MVKHIRYVITVYGEKPPFIPENRGYYAVIPGVMQTLIDERETPAVFRSRLRESGDALADIICPTDAFASELEIALRAVGKFKRIERTSEVVDFDMLDKGVQ